MSHPVRGGRPHPAAAALMEARPTKRRRAPLVAQRPFEGWRQLREAVTIEMRPRRFH